MAIDDKLSDAHCEYKGYLHYRSQDTDLPNTFYCCVQDSGCPYYQLLDNKEYCHKRSE